eukprot:g48885.t1
MICAGKKERNCEPSKPTQFTDGKTVRFLRLSLGTHRNKPICGEYLATGGFPVTLQLPKEEKEKVFFKCVNFFESRAAVAMGKGPDEVMKPLARGDRMCEHDWENVTHDGMAAFLCSVCGAQT